MMKKLDANSYVSAGLAIALVSAVATGGITYGQVSEKIRNLEAGQGQIKDIEDDIEEIRSNLNRINTKQQILLDRQERATDDINDKLDKILAKRVEE